jgi:hypothetical protein
MTNESNVELSTEVSFSITDDEQAREELHQAAYDEGAFYAETDWQWALKEDEDVRPASMAEHCSLAWAFISGTVCPEWSSEHHRLSFFIGYEDRATELADAGESGYEALAEAGTVADTGGWVLQSDPWRAKASSTEKALRAVRAAWAGAAAWMARAANGSGVDRIRADAAQIRAEAAGDCGLGSRYVSVSAPVVAH